MNIKLTVSGGRLRQLTPLELRAITADAAIGMAAVVKGNFVRLASRSGSRHYWHGAAAGTQVEQGSRGVAAAVVVRHKGVRLHLRGGIVRPTGRPSAATGRPTKSLLIPFRDSPLRLRNKTLAELGIPNERIFVIKSRRGCPILVATEAQQKKTRLIYLGKLVKQSHHRPRPEVLPSESALRRAATQAASQSLNTILRH